MRLSNCK